MKNRLKTFCKLIVLTAVMALPLQMRAESDPEKLADLTWIQMLNSVDCGKGSDLVKRFQEKEARNVLLKSYKKDKHSNCNVENIRNKEVLLITIPASDLFGPNSTVLLEDAAKYLEPIKRYLKQPDVWRVMLIMHTDNTGSPGYREKITEDRALAVTEWFENQPGLDTSYLFPYALSDKQPLAGCPNNNIDNRAKNRRLEIYLIPGEKMVDQAKHGRIAF